MKVAIITLMGNFNYGNRWQNYALERTIRNMGHDVCTLGCEIKKPAIIRFLKKYITVDNAIKPKPLYQIRQEKKFERFNRKNINIKYVKNATGQFGDYLELEYDKFIVGSDQVWNPFFWPSDYNCKEANNYFLSFIGDKKKKVSYAASFGVSCIPDFWRNKFQEELKKFSSVSVREQDGLTLLRDLNIHNTSLVPDPTFLLNHQEWASIQKKTKRNINFNYVLIYFFGEISSEIRTAIRSYQNKIGLEIINLNDPKCPFYCSGPDEVLYLVNNANAVFTDSYHFTVFSIIYNVPFFIYNRVQKGKSDMSGRLATLLDNVGLIGRFNIFPNSDNDRIEFDSVNKLMLKMSEDGKKYLKNILR